MKPSRARVCANLAAAALFFGAGAEAFEIHVAPGGHDANPGTPAQPVATPQGAQALVRTLVQAGLTEPADVVFQAGTYDLDATLELRPEDSGTAAFPVTWRAATNETVVLNGGKTITNTWVDGGSGVWHVDLGGVGLGTNDWNFRQLFVDGSRATRARLPNLSEANPFLYATGGGFDHVIIDPALVKSEWGTAADAQINIVPQSRFFNQWNTVTGVNTGTGRIDIADSERHRNIDSGSWFWIEGVREELDEPGEWFLDTTSGRLYYMPEPGVDPNTLTFVAPFLNRIVNAQGDVNAGTHVEHVHFKGIEFRHTTFSLGHIEARVHTDTAIMFENTNDSSVENCHFENIGGYALWLHLDSRRNVFDHNTVLYSGGGGVLLTGARLSYMDDTKVYTPGEAASKVAPILNEITYNTVEHCGKIRYYGGGVHLDSRPFSMSMAPGNYIAHNHFNDLSRNGIFAFRNQGGNVVEYNHIHNAMQTTIDGACIHFGTMNHLNAPNFILNNWLYDIWGYEQKPDGNPIRHLANGVFLDWDTSNTTVMDNWIYNAGGTAVKVIWNNWNVVTSGNPSSSTPITPPFVAEVGPGGTATHGIDLAANRLTGSIIHYTDSAHFSTTGTWTQDSAVGLAGLFVFNFLVGTAADPAEAVYTLPITEDGIYQISLLYKPGADRASNVPVAIAHADGTAQVIWNMQQGSQHGFAVEVGNYRCAAAQTNTVTLSTTGANGKVIADAVAFVKIEDNEPPAAANVQISGGAYIGGTMTGSYDYSDPENDLEGDSRFRWYRSDDAVLDAGDAVISGATARSYVVQPGDSGKYLFFEVTPVALTGLSDGAAAPSTASAQIAPNDPPTATAVYISGTPMPGAQLTGAYTYHDADGDPEGASLLRWYRSDDAVLDPGDVIVAGVLEVVPVSVKTSISLNAQRLAGNLFNPNGMSASGEELFNLDGSQPGEPTSADGVSWVTPSGSESSLLSGRKAWFVADLGARYALDELRTWNFQWDHSTGDLSNRGISQFDLYLRDSEADTDDGTAGGTPVNVDLSAATFDLGSADPWYVALPDQAVARAPNADGYAGQSYGLTGQSGRFLALVADSYYGGNGIALGKVRLRIGQSSTQYTPVAEDAGKYIMFEVTPVAAAGNPWGPPAYSSIGPVGQENAPPVASAVSISGVAREGDTLTGQYAYSDAEGDPEGASLYQWFLSQDSVLDGNDTALPGATNQTYLVQAGNDGAFFFFGVTPVAASGSPTGTPAVSDGLERVDPGQGVPVPVAWKQSNSYSALRRADFLSNGAGMDGAETLLYNLDGTQPGEPTSANGVSWLTTSNGDEATAASEGRVWIVADLGAPYNLASLEIWNFQWNLNGSDDLSNRGVSQFDILVRNAEADTDDGTAGGTPINLDNPGDNATIDNDAVFDLGSSNPWQVALADQALDQAPNTDAYAGQRFDLAGNVARFVALRVNSYHGGNGIGLGKIRFTEVAPRPLRIAAHYDGSDLVFTWENEAGRLYNLISSTNVLAATVPWPPYLDGVTVTTNLAADLSGTNTLIVPLPAHTPRCFFALEQS